MRLFAGLCFIATIQAASASEAGLSPEKALESFQLAEDLKIELVAAEPLVASPCAIAFDEKGRLFVAENRGYPRMESPPQGRVAMLVDEDGDGKMDRRTEFAEGLTYPNGVLPWKDGLIVTCAPDVLFLRDANGDGKADERRVLLTGFDTTQSTQLRVNAPQIGPDGWIYLAAGLSGGSITCPEHPERPALKMTSDVKFHPDTLVVELVNGRSQFGQSFDAEGRRFICMNRLPVQHVVLSSHWLTRNPNFAFSDTVQDCNERLVKTAIKGGGDGVRLFPISANITTADSHQGSFSAACGVLIWRGGALPSRYDGCAFSCDPTGNLIHVDRLEPHGASFQAVPLLQNQEMIASRDDWCRPVYLARGPDGALYVADMYRKIIEHPDYLPEAVRGRMDFESGRKQGRIWRVTGKEKRAATKLPEYKDEFAGIRPAAQDMSLAKKLAADPSVRVRFCLALVLGDSQSAESLEILANIAVRDAGDKWARAAVLSGIGGREAAFLNVLWPKLRLGSEAELELLISLGQCFPDVDELESATRKLNAPPSVELSALWVGFHERRGIKSGTNQVIAASFEFAIESLEDKNCPTPQRMVHIRLLAADTWGHAASALQQAWDQHSDETSRAALVRSFVHLDGVRAASFLLKPNAWATYSPVMRETILNALFAKNQLEGVLQAIETKSLPASALTQPRRQVFAKSSNVAIRSRAESLFSSQPTDRMAALKRANNALRLSAKPAHGHEVFKQLCVSCHRLEREGSNVGPDLFDIRNQPKENIVFHIVMPESEVAPAFTAYACETKTGRTIAGILISETSSSITLRQPAGIEETILRTEIKSLTALPGSLMPAGLEAAMTEQDLADLVAYLKGE